MAHPSRKAWVNDLLKQLGDVPVAWAEPPWATPKHQEAIWRTRRAALLTHTDAPFHCIVQDDAILARDFVRRVSSLVDHGDRYLYMLFYRNKRGWDQAIRLAHEAERTNRGYFTIPYTCMLGPGVVIPTARIPDLIAFGDQCEARLGDDPRMKLWMRQNDLEFFVPIPSLVNHRAGESFIGHPQQRVAWRFAG